MPRGEQGPGNWGQAILGSQGRLPASGRFVQRNPGLRTELRFRTRSFPDPTSNKERGMVKSKTRDTGMGTKVSKFNTLPPWEKLEYRCSAITVGGGG